MAAATANLLAEEMVRITTEGMDRADQQTDALGQKFGKMGESARKAEGFVRQLSRSLASMASGPSRMFGSLQSSLQGLQSSISKITGPLKALSISGALGIGGIAAGAMRGTVQGERLGKAFELLSRVVGDQLAPYIEALTAGITGLASWFNSLSQSTKENITQWALIGTGIATVAALIPAVISGVAAIAGAFAVLTSPITLTIAAIAAVTAAATKMFNYFQDGGADAAEATQDSNKGWLESLVRGIQWAVTAMAKMFNWIMDKAAKVSDWIGQQLANAGEFTGLLPEGTADMYRSMDPMKPFQLDIPKIDQFFDHVARRAKQADQDFSGLTEGLSGIGDKMKVAFSSAKAGGQGFQMKLKVGFESADQSWQRLQTAFNEQAGARLSMEQQTLDATKQVAGGMIQAVSTLTQIKDLLPVVR